MHFLKELIDAPILEDPANNHKNIHRHFNRYSKGMFIGPALKITKSKPRITLKGSHEYEDLIQEVVLNTTQGLVEVKGVLITGDDIKEDLNEMGLDWPLKASTGKTKNFKATIEASIDKEIFLESVKKFRENSYLLLSFIVNPTCKVTTKNRIPQPSKKKVEEDDVNKRVQFCTGVITNTDKHKDLVLDLALTDFKLDLPNSWKNITITNNYKIDEIELPKGIKNSTLLRVLAIRKGTITRTVNVDNELIEKQYSIVV